PPVIQRLDRSEAVGEGAGNDPYGLACSGLINELRHDAVVATRKDIFHRRPGHGLRAVPLRADEVPHAERSVDRSPGLVIGIKADEDIVGKQRDQHVFALARMAAQLAEARAETLKRLAAQMLDGEGFLAGKRLDDVPALDQRQVTGLAVSGRSKGLAAFGP